MRLLLISNSTNFGGGYLDHALEPIQRFLGSQITRVLFVPYAGVTVTFDDYARKVTDKIAMIGYQVDSIHRFADKRRAIAEAQAIAVGGGNTFYLLDRLYQDQLLPELRRKVLDGTPFLGWSAGANVACPTIMTTNDMPIVQPPSFKALGLIPFQINPHYTEEVIPRHQGETRAQRLHEYLVANPEVTVVGLREGSILQVEGEGMELLGQNQLKVFRYGAEDRDYTPQDDLRFLLQ